MDLERIERAGDREMRLREYRKRGLLIDRGLPLVHEMCDALLFAKARKWLRVMVAERPSREHVAPLSSAIVRTVGDGQEHLSGQDSGGYWAVPEREHALMLWFDLFMCTWRSLLPPPQWREKLAVLLGISGRTVIRPFASPIPWWERNRGSAHHPRGYHCWRLREHDEPSQIAHVSPYIHTGVSISVKGSVIAGSWCPPLPAFDADLKPLTQEGAS